MRKVADLHYVLEGNYGYGWDFLGEYDNQNEACADLATYEENEPEYHHRIIKVRR